MLPPTGSLICRLNTPDLAGYRNIQCSLLASTFVRQPFHATQRYALSHVYLLELDLTLDTACLGEETNRECHTVPIVSKTALMPD